MKEIIEGKCVDYTHDGQGVVKVNNRVVFVPSLLIGEVAEIEILYRKKDFDVGKIKKIIKFSEDRITPKCQCATACGGCSFQNLNYKKQLELKDNLAKETLKRIGGIDLPITKIYGMDEPYYYRNKIQVPFGYDKQKRLVYGFYKFKSHDIVPFKECVIQDKVHINILSTIKKLMLDMNIKAYNEDDGSGVLRHCLIRVAKKTNQVMVVLVVKSLNFPSKNNFIKALINECNEINTIVLNENPRKTNVILGNKEKVVFGKGYIIDELLGIKFKISSKSFYQVNHSQCEVLYDLALKEANVNSNDVMLDAYCGIGSIGLIFSKFVKCVDGVEIIPEAIKDAKENIKLNNITNAHYFCSDINNFVINKHYDLMVIDPPRKGIDDKFMNSILKLKPTKIVYISCNVSTLARDLKILSKLYKIQSINLVDMFPHTFHIESVVSLSL